MPFHLVVFSALFKTNIFSLEARGREGNEKCVYRVVKLSSFWVVGQGGHWVPRDGGDVAEDEGQSGAHFQGSQQKRHLPSVDVAEELR